MHGEPGETVLTPGAGDMEPSMGQYQYIYQLLANLFGEGNFSVTILDEDALPSYAKEEMNELVYERGLTQYNTGIQQTHIQPVFPIWSRLMEMQLCGNTYYYIIDGRRMCSSCAYVFTEEQDEAIELPDSFPTISP